MRITSYRSILLRRSWFFIISFTIISARKRFAVPREDEEPTAPTPIRLFQSRREGTGEKASNTAIPESPLRHEDQGEDPVPKCSFCLRGPCITSSPFKPQGRGNARISNHTKRRKDYKWYWRTLKDCGLWDNPQHLEKKLELGCLIDDVREVMPHCVIKDVRERWPNPPDVPYQGHRRS